MRMEARVAVFELAVLHLLLAAGSHSFSTALFGFVVPCAEQHYETKSAWACDFVKGCIDHTVTLAGCFIT